MTLDGIMTADTHYLCSSWVSCRKCVGFSPVILKFLFLSLCISLTYHVENAYFESHGNVDLLVFIKDFLICMTHS